MTKISDLKPALLAAAIGLASLPAVSAIALGAGETVGTSETEIRAALEAAGYEVGEIEFEKNEIEVEARRDAVNYEIEVSPETGVILEIEEDDDDD